MTTTNTFLLALLFCLLVPTGAWAQIADADGDGVPDTDDACPTENASLFDGDGDGCIDPFAHARHIEYWDAGDLPFTYVVHELGVRLISIEETQYDPGDDIAELVRGIDVWASVPGANMASVFAGTTPDSTADGLDGINQVTFRDPDFVSLFGNAVIAVGITTSFTEASVFDGQPVRPGQIVDADMLFNPTRVFSADTSGSAVEIAAVATHEAGHLFGLNHSALVEATMFPALPAGFDATTLEIDDEVLAFMSYPDPGSIATATVMSGTILDGATGLPVPGAAVFALPAGTDDPVAVQFTLPDGTWMLAGLAPGSYDVFVAPLDGSDDVNGVVPGYINTLIDSTAQTLFLSEYYSAAESADDDRELRTSITLVAGVPVENVDVITNADNAPPFVVDSTPQNGQADVDAQGVILVRFSEPIAFSTVANSGGNRFRMTFEGAGGPVEVAGQLVALGTKDVLVFNPAEPLEFDRLYTLSLDAGIEDVFGNAMTAPFSAQFTVESAPPLDVVTISPEAVVVGSIVVIYGEGFDTTDAANNVVSFGGVSAPADQATRNTLVATVPEGIALGRFAVNVSNTAQTAPTTLSALGVEATDTARATEVASIPLSGLPNQLVLTPDLQWALTATDFGLEAVGLGTAAFGTTRGVPYASGLDGIATAPGNERSYGVSREEALLYVIDTDDGGDPEFPSVTFLTAQAEIPTGAAPLGIAVDPTGTEAWVTTAAGLVQIWDLDPESDTLFEQIGEIDPQVAGLKSDLAFGRAGTRAYALGNDALIVIDVQQRTILRTVPLSGEPASAVEAPQGNLVYVTDLDGNLSVVPFDATSVSQEIDADGSLRGIDLSPTGGLAYAADRLDEEVVIVDLRETEASFRTVIGTFATGEDPVDVIATPDGSGVITVSEGSQTLNIFGISFGPVIESLSPRFVREGDLIAVAGSSFAVWDSTLNNNGTFSSVDFDGQLVGPGTGGANDVGFYFEGGWARVPTGFDGGPVRVIATTPVSKVGGPEAGLTRAIPLAETSASNPVQVSVWSAQDLENTLGSLNEGPFVDVIDNLQGSVNLDLLVHPGGDYVLVGTSANEVVAIDIRESSPTFLEVIATIAVDASDPDDPNGWFGATRVFTPNGERIYTHNGRVLNSFDARIDSPTFGQQLAVVDFSLVDPNGLIFQFASLTQLNVSPNGEYLFVGVNSFETTVAVRLVGSGRDQAFAELNLSGGDTSGPMAFHPNGRWAYMLTGSGQAEIISLDPFATSFLNTLTVIDLADQTIEDMAAMLDGSGLLFLTREGGLGGQWNLVFRAFSDDPSDIGFGREQVLEFSSPTSQASLRLHPNGRRAAIVIPERRVTYVDLSPNFDPNSELVFTGINDIESLGLFLFAAEWSPDGKRLFGVEQTDSVVRTYDFSDSPFIGNYSVISGDQQTGVVGEALPAPIRVRAIDDSNDPVPNAVTRVTVTDGSGGTIDGSLAERIIVADENGIVSVNWTLGPNVGPNQIRFENSIGIGVFASAWGVVSPESIPLDLVQVLPLDGSADVSATSAAQAVFSRAVDRTTIDATTVVLRDAITGLPVPSFIGFSSEDRRITLIPNAPLVFEGTYQIEIAATIEDLEGNALGAASTTAFTTQAAPAPLLGSITPPAGTVGSTIVVSGVGFDAEAANNTVTLGGVFVPLNDATINSLQFTVPSGVSTGALEVSVNGTPAGALEFTVLEPTSIPIDSVDDTVELGVATQSLAVLPDGTRGYAVSTTEDAVIPIDLVSLTNGSRIEVGDQPIGAVSDVYGTFVYVANRGSESVSVLDTATDTVVATIALDAAPQEILASPNGDRIYVVTPEGQAVEVIDVDASSSTYNTVTARLQTGSSTSGASISPDGSVLFLGTSDGFLTIGLTVSDFGVTARLQTGSSTSGASISPDGTLLILITDDDEILLVDIQGAGFGTVTARLQTGSSTSGASISPDGAILYVITADTDEILAFAINLPGTISVLEGIPIVQLELIATIDAGDDPRWIAFDPRDPTVAFVGANGDRRISVFGRVGVDPPTDCETFEVVFGTSWDGISLQSIFDDQYGVGAIDVLTDYEGYQCGDAVVPYWLDEAVDGWLIREIADASIRNTLGWYAEDFSPPVIDGVDDGVIFTGGDGGGATAFVSFPGITRFGLYLDPNGSQDAINAPQPELFFTNRRYNDVGPDGAGAVHAPAGGDPQALIYNVTHLRGGVPTYVIAWEDIDSGAEITPAYSDGKTDNDFNDLVVEIRASSPVRAVVTSLEVAAVEEGVRVAWDLAGADRADRFAVERRDAEGSFAEVASIDGAQTERTWIDRSLTAAGTYAYRVAAFVDGTRVVSQEAQVSFAPLRPSQTRLVGAWPNPFNPKTTIEYSLARPGRVELRIYNLAGRRVRTVDLGQRPAGMGQIEWTGEDDEGRRAASGVYLVRMVSPAETGALRLILVK